MTKPVKAIRAWAVVRDGKPITIGSRKQMMECARVWNPAVPGHSVCRVEIRPIQKSRRKRG